MKLIFPAIALTFMALGAHAAVPGKGITGGAPFTIYRLWSKTGIPLWGTIHGFLMEFSPAERQDVVKFLNEQFYRFQ